MRATLALCCVALLLACGSGAANQPSGVRDVSVTVSVTTYVPGRTPAQQTQVFSLTCNPAAGTLLHAARICRDIEQHPRAMLDPPSSRLACHGPVVFGHRSDVTVRFNGRTRHLGGREWCWPQGAAVGVYLAATSPGNDVQLARNEARLRCAEDPKLLAEPMPRTLVNLCQYGWSKGQRARIFGQLALEALRPKLSFPLGPGAGSCSARKVVADPFGRWCSVSVTDNGFAGATVTFVATWPALGGTARHTWRVAVNAYGGVVVGETGPTPPG